VLVYRQPLLIAWHTGGLIFVTAAAGHYTYPQVLGAMMVAGGLVLLAGVSRLTARLATLVPAPIVFGILAGSIMPFVVRVFSDASTNRAIIGATLLAYLLSRRLLPATIPPL
jgi:benzoate membrane transport protein